MDFDTFRTDTAFEILGVIWGCDMSPYLPREIWILTNFELIQLSRYGVPIRA